MAVLVVRCSPALNGRPSSLPSSPARGWVEGVNTANVAAVLFFWPAAVGNYMSARDAMQIAERRNEHLMTIYNEKQCDNPANANLRFSVPATLLAPIGQGGL